MMATTPYILPLIVTIFLNRCSLLVVSNVYTVNNYLSEFVAYIRSGNV